MLVYSKIFVCNECMQDKNSKIECFCENGCISSKKIELVNGCVYVNEDGIRCKKKRWKYLYVCEIHTYVDEIYIEKISNIKNIL